MILEILVFLLSFAVLIGILLYIPWRMRDLFGIMKKRYVFIPFFSMILLTIVFMVLNDIVANPFVFGIYRTLSIWFGGLIFAFCSLVLFEAVYGIFRLLKSGLMPGRVRLSKDREFPKRKAGVAIMAVTLLLSIYGVVNAYDIDVVRVDVEVENLNGTVDIAVLADVHVGSGGGKQRLSSIVEETNSLDPDIVLIPGDLVDSAAYITEDMLSPLGNLNAPAYFVTGNHEDYQDNKTLLRALDRCGVRVLDNEAIITHGIQLVGLRYMRADNGTTGEDLGNEDNRTIQNVLGDMNLSDSAPVVMMHHSPVGLEYASQAGVDLYVAGHTHGGGQFFPFAPLIGMGFEEYRGTARYKDMTVHVSQGAGFWFIPMRIGTNSEITLIRLSGN